MPPSHGFSLSTREVLHFDMRASGKTKTEMARHFNLTLCRINGIERRVVARAKKSINKMHGFSPNLKTPHLLVAVSHYGRAAEMLEDWENACQWIMETHQLNPDSLALKLLNLRARLGDIDDSLRESLIVFLCEKGFELDAPGCPGMGCDELTAWQIERRNCLWGLKNYFFDWYGVVQNGRGWELANKWDISNRCQLQELHPTPGEAQFRLVEAFLDSDGPSLQYFCRMAQACKDGVKRGDCLNYQITRLDHSSKSLNEL